MNLFHYRCFSRFGVGAALTALPCGIQLSLTPRALQRFSTRAAGFFPAPGTRPSKVRNLRNLFGRTALTGQDVQTPHGVIARLRDPKKRASGGGGNGAP